jgi:hypothetical protein
LRRMEAAIENDSGKRMKDTLARGREVRERQWGEEDSLGPADENLLSADGDGADLRHDDQGDIVGPHLNNQDDRSRTRDRGEVRIRKEGRGR